MVISVSVLTRSLDWPPGQVDKDAEAARIGGARAIGVASGRSSAGELRDAGADAVLDDLADAAAVVAAVDRLTLPLRS